MEDIIVELSATGTFAIACFGVVFCLMQTKCSPLRSSFAAFLAAVAVNNIPDAFGELLEALPRSFGTMIDFAVWPSSFFLAPLLWIYVYILTSETQRRPAHLTKHFVLPGLAIFVALVVLASPSHVRDVLLSDNPEIDTASTMALAVSLGLLQLTVHPQIALYLFLTLRRLVRFRLKLRDVYASTERHELWWIYVIGALGVLFWLAMTLLLVGVFVPAPDQIPPTIINTASIAGFALVTATVLWGLRQRPPLMRDTDNSGPDGPVDDHSSEKYQKSALRREDSQRLRRKLRAAMEVDQLHRNSNLSLWVLAHHIGASPNYISQTLNEEIGESFFDFVNGYRVADAMNMLRETEKSVLTITYDVGFNARSSFYNAFKRSTGQTPTSYRKTVSQRDGLDDAKA